MIKRNVQKDKGSMSISRPFHLYHLQARRGGGGRCLGGGGGGGAVLGGGGRGGEGGGTWGGCDWGAVGGGGWVAVARERAPRVGGKSTAKK
jgi:hypothetical protein